MSLRIDPGRSNGRINVLIAGSAPGTQGKPGPRITGLMLNGDNILTVIMADGSQAQCNAEVLVQNAAANAVSAVTESLVFFVDEHGARIGIELPTQDPQKRGYAWLNGTYICVSDGPNS